MEASVITGIVVGTSTLLGVVLTSFAQSRSQRSNQQFQRTLDAERHERDKTERDKAQAIHRLTEAHIALSKIARAFSITNLDILWNDGISEGEFGHRYLSACADMDALLAFAQLHEPSIDEYIKQLHLPMGKYWMNLKSILSLTQSGTAVDSTSFCLQAAHAAAQEISSKVADAQWRLTQAMERHGG